jgi:hypothetical protein
MERRKPSFFAAEDASAGRNEIRAAGRNEIRWQG